MHAFLVAPQNLFAASHFFVVVLHRKCSLELDIAVFINLYADGTRLVGNQKVLEVTVVDLHQCYREREVCCSVLKFFQFLVHVPDCQLGQSRHPSIALESVGLTSPSLTISD